MLYSFWEHKKLSLDKFNALLYLCRLMLNAQHLHLSFKNC